MTQARFALGPIQVQPMYIVIDGKEFQVTYEEHDGTDWHQKQITVDEATLQTRIGDVFAKTKSDFQQRLQSAREGQDSVTIDFNAKHKFTELTFTHRDASGRGTPDPLFSGPQEREEYFDESSTEIAARDGISEPRRVRRQAAVAIKELNKLAKLLASGKRRALPPITPLPASVPASPSTPPSSPASTSRHSDREDDDVTASEAEKDGVVSDPESEVSVVAASDSDKVGKAAKSKVRNSDDEPGSESDAAGNISSSSVKKKARKRSKARRPVSSDSEDETQPVRTKKPRSSSTAKVSKAAPKSLGPDSVSDVRGKPSTLLERPRNTASRLEDDGLYANPLDDLDDDDVPEFAELRTRFEALRDSQRPAATSPVSEEENEGSGEEEEADQVVDVPHTPSATPAAPRTAVRAEATVRRELSDAEDDEDDADVPQMDELEARFAALKDV